MPKISLKKKDEVMHVVENEGDSKRCDLVMCGEENVSATTGLYILAITGTHSIPDFRIAAAYSNYSTIVYSVDEKISKVITLEHNDSPIVGIKFSHTSKHILYTAMRNGIITACDLRAKGKIIATIRDSVPDGKLRPYSSFEISKDDRLVVAGSEHVGGDAFILFWDLRYNNGKTEGNGNLLGGYWESHMDDVTALAFHPEQLDILASGSTDGLINIFDLRKPKEDLALKYSLNTESSVDRLGWLEDENIWCTTHTHGLQLWDCEDAEPYGKFERDSLGAALNSYSDTCYVVKMHNTHGRPFLLAGSNSSNGELRGLRIDDGNLETCYNLPGNGQLVRDSWFHEKSGTLITGGEKGIVNLWRENETSQQDVSKFSIKFDGKARDKLPRSKPY